jgi:hypothetical protein
MDFSFPLVDAKIDRSVMFLRVFVEKLRDAHGAEPRF